MVAGTAPDVFTDHLAKYPEFAANDQLVDIQPFVERDGVDVGVYLGELADLWARDGARFGLPKDWDTIAIVVNQPAIEAAGVSLDDVNSLNWNQTDGGSFGEMIAQLSVDENGNNGLSADFDKTKVKQYGLIINGAGEAYGQTEWSWLTATTGWTYNDGLYDTKYYYNDARFIDSIQWVADHDGQGLHHAPGAGHQLGRLRLLQRWHGCPARQRLVDDRRPLPTTPPSRSPLPDCPKAPKAARACSMAWPTPSGLAPSTKKRPGSG